MACVVALLLKSHVFDMYYWVFGHHSNLLTIKADTSFLSTIMKGERIEDRCFSAENQVVDDDCYIMVAFHKVVLDALFFVFFNFLAFCEMNAWI